LFSSDGNPFQSFTISTSDFQAANSDVRVLVASALWTEEPNGLWNAEVDEQVYYESTTQDGRIEILFGNSTYGKIPPLGSNNIEVKYYITRGAAANTSVTGVAVTSLYNTLIVGQTISAISEGLDKDSLNFYRYTTPRLYASGRRIVTRDDGKAMILTYPDVAILDCNFVGERELGPGLVQYQNVAGVVLLTGSPMNSAQRTAFLAWVDKFKMSALQILIITPVEISTNVDLNLVIDKNYTGSEVTTAVTAAISAFLTPQLGSLGKTVYLSDLYDFIMDVPGVVHCDILTPTNNHFTAFKRAKFLSQCFYFMSD
jgi:hypothetical protein